MQQQIDSYAREKANIHVVIKESSKQIMDYMLNYDVADFKEVSVYTVYRAFVMMQKTIASVVNKFRLRD